MVTLKKNRLPAQDRLRDLFSYDPNTGVFVRLRQAGGQMPGAVAGCSKRKGYIGISVDGQLYFAHRLAWVYVYGDEPIGEIDHINHDPSDNRIANLRAVSRKQNQENYSRRIDNTSGITGVDFRNGRWRARICHSGKLLTLGLFRAKEDAVNARREAERKVWTHAPSI